MPEVSRAQFWKSDPNQMALPGMEEHSHPGARLLSQGYHFEHEAMEIPGGAWNHESHPIEHTLSTMTPEGHTAGKLSWVHGNAPAVGLSPGEISMVETHGPRHTGIATAMYGVGRQMARVKPRHSTIRTAAGDGWAKTTVAKYGGRVPKKNIG